MAIESATTINQLVATNPLVNDPVSEGDDHIRLLKSTVKNTFPNITAPVTPTHGYLNQMNIPNVIVCWPTATPPTGWKLCSASAGNTSTGQAIPNLNTASRVGTTYWIIKD